MRLTLAPLTDFDIGGIVAAFIAFVAYRVGALSGGGALAAFVIGTAVFGGLGIPGAYVLLAFFVPSIALSRTGRARKRKLVDIGKSGPRDAAQVLANGGIAAACALAAFYLDPHYAAAFAGSLAAATADTWGTEIGTLVSAQPRSIFTLRPIATGLSGGITTAGTLAELAGAFFIAADCRKRRLPLLFPRSSPAASRARSSTRSWAARSNRCAGVRTADVPAKPSPTPAAPTPITSAAWAGSVTTPSTSPAA